jgi:hypothetical protein
MDNQLLQNYILQRLEELENGRDLDDLKSKGKLSFGIESKEFSHLPSWTELLKKKKNLVNMAWVNAILLSLMIVAIVGDLWQKFEQNWLKALFYWLALSSIVLLFYVIGTFFSLFYEFRRIERVIRKLIYEDLLQRLGNMKD